MARKQSGIPEYRGYLVHLTHYDPAWSRTKDQEKPFELAVAREIVDAMAKHNFNMLLIGVSDGIRYKSHPEFRRHYSQPISVLKKLADYGRKNGMQIVPKLNFSRSEINRHNQWMRKEGQQWHEQFDDEAFFKVAFDAIDEVIEVCRPEEFFHIGMDEDHDRSHKQYLQAIASLRDGLKKRGLRTICWSDSALDYPSGQVYREKTELAERKAHRDIVRILWNYWAVPAKEMKAIRRRGIELWGAPGARTPQLTRDFRDALLACGGNGLIMTNWKPCTSEYRDMLVHRVHEYGPVYAGQ